MDKFKAAAKAISFCIKEIKTNHVPPEENAIWSVGTSSKPRITEAVLMAALEALTLAMQQDGVLIQVPEGRYDIEAKGGGSDGTPGYIKITAAASSSK